MRGRPPLTRVAVGQIRRLRRAGHSTRETARLLGVSPGTVARYAQGPSRRDSTPEERQRAADRYRRGESLREIAAGPPRRSHEAVRGWLLRAGVEIRGRGSRSPF